jgi:hypothetical protein
MSAKWTKVGVMWKGKEAGKLPSGRPDGLLAAILPNGARLVVIKNERKQKDSDPDYDVMIVTSEEEKKDTTPAFANDPPF